MSDGFTTVTKKKGKGKKPPAPQYLFIDPARVGREWPPSMRNSNPAHGVTTVDFSQLTQVATSAGLSEMVAIPDAARGAGTGKYGAQRLRLLVVEGWWARKHRDIWKLRAYIKNFLDLPARLLPRRAVDEDASDPEPVLLNEHYVIISAHAPRSTLTGQVIDEQVRTHIYVVPTPGRVEEFPDAQVMWEATQAARPYEESVGAFQLYVLKWFSDQSCHAEPATLTQVSKLDYPAVMQGYIDVISDLMAPN